MEQAVYEIICFIFHLFINDIKDTVVNYYGTVMGLFEYIFASVLSPAWLKTIKQIITSK